VLADLQRLGYVDDKRFATAKATAAAKYKQHGYRRAQLELRKAGVDDATARKAIEDVYDPHDSLEVARNLAQKKAASLRKLDPVVARRRLAGMLGRRGFDYDTIRPVIDEVLGYGDESSSDS
jgi:regulatory protein